ncbi:MAG: hypothetical protein JOY61_15815 [Chloroflexi bacterium]|nr:hypothetical protein [Chloroflexota bacterium]
MDKAAAELAARVAQALIAAGYDPQEVAVRVERGKSGQLELRLRAEVPGLKEDELVGLFAGLLASGEQAQAAPPERQPPRRGWPAARFRRPPQTRPGSAPG